MAKIALQPYSLGIDVGGTQVKTICIDSTERELSRVTFDTRADLTEGWPSHIRGIVDQICEELGARPMHIGLSAPGIAGSDGRTIWWMMGRLEAVMGVDWQPVSARIERAAATSTGGFVFIAVG